jgi:5-methylcytosine-specific restriction endonuclease McrA
MGAPAFIQAPPISDENPYSRYELYRWSCLVRERDEMVCVMCKRQCLKRAEVRAKLATLSMTTGHDFIMAEEYDGLLGEAHHIRAKYHHPEKALDLDNGVTLCWRCHREVVHSTGTKGNNHRTFTYPFRMYTLRNASARAFNEANQIRVSRRFRYGP